MQVSSIRIEEADNGYVVNISYRSKKLGEYIENDKMVFDDEDDLISFIKDALTSVKKIKRTLTGAVESAMNTVSRRK